LTTKSSRRSHPPLTQEEKRIVRAADEALRRVGWRAVPARERRRAAVALKYDYYWHKAEKRIDIREIDGFGPLATRAIAEHRTGMKYDRLYTLWQAIARLRSDEAIVEIGSYRGGSAHFIGGALRWFGRTNRLFVCDTFSGHAVADERVDGPHRVGEQFVGTSYEAVAAYLAPFENVSVVAGDFRTTSGELEPLAPFALAHVDVDVFAVTRYALEFLAPRLVAGGMIVVDDYGFTTCPGAKQAVDEFAAGHQEFAAFHLLTGQALLVRVAPAR
jgi:O-methyltransferase